MNLEKLAHKVDFINPAKMRAHETINENRLDELKGIIVRNGYVDYPVLLDRDFNVILDGHHRAAALQSLELDRAPVIRVDYFDESVIVVEPRPNCPINPLTKQDILRMGLSREVFPPKSTRHVLQFPEQRIDYPLDKLTNHK